MTFDWETGTETMTDGERVSWFVDGDEVVVESNLAKNAIYLSVRQTENMISGLATMLNTIKEMRNRG